MAPPDDADGGVLASASRPDRGSSQSFSGGLDFGLGDELDQPPMRRRSSTFPLPMTMAALALGPAPAPARFERQTTSFNGQYGMPLAAPELAGEDRPIVGEEGNPTSVSPWLESGLGRRAQLLLVIIFMCVDPSRYILDAWALRHNEHTIVVAQALVVAQSVIGFSSALLVTGCCEGMSGLKAAFAWREVLRCLPISLLFSLSQAAVVHAFSQGLGAAVAVALGYLYMPLCTLISRWMFSRTYGWLELHALVLLSLSIVTFSELRSRAISLTESTQGVSFILLSVVLSCLGACLAEWVLKPKYSPANTQRFYLQKVRFEVWGVVTSIVVLELIARHQVVDRFTGWDYKLTASLACRVVQSWMAGVVAKHSSTVAKAVIQCLSLLIVFFFGDLVVFKVGIGSIEISLLAIVVALSAFLYQMGRQRTVMEAMRANAALQVQTQQQQEGEQRSEQPEGPRGPEDADAGDHAVPDLPARSVSDLTDYGRADAARSRALLRGSGGIGVRALPSACVVQDANVLAPQEFDFAAPQGDAQAGTATGEHRLPEVPDLELLELAQEQATVNSSSLGQWILSRLGVAAQICCVATFIVSDAGRTIIYEWSINGTAIVQQSIVVAMSGASIVVGVVLAGILDGPAGVKAALNPREVMRCLLVAACFSLSQTAQIYSFGVGISAVENVVIGYFYMPLSALLSRWIFRRAYTGLEWLALLLLVLSASTFVLMQKSDGGSGGMNPMGVAFVLGSVVLSCLGSILAEKIMKAGSSPFYIQKVHLEVGGLFSALAMLFISGAVSKRPNDAFWKERDVGGGHMQSGIFVAWSPKIVLALVATLLQSWLGGLVAKRLSTVVRAVAQCLSLLLIYFVGDLILKHIAFDWPVGSMACVVALTVQVFAQAGKRKVKHPARPEPSAGQTLQAQEEQDPALSPDTGGVGAGPSTLSCAGGQPAPADGTSSGGSGPSGRAAASAPLLQGVTGGSRSCCDLQDPIVQSSTGGSA